MKNAYMYYIYDKILTIIFLIIAVIVGEIELKSKALVAGALLAIVLNIISEYLEKGFRVFKFIIFDVKNGKITKEATLEHIGISWWRLHWWHSHQYTEVGFREKELSGIYYVFGEDRELLAIPEGHNKAVINTRDRVQVTYYEKSKLIVSIRKID